MNRENPAGQKHSNRHHVYPKSRVPMLYRAGKRKLLGKWLILHDVPVVSHSALHAIFGNRTPEEQLKLLKEICLPAANFPRGDNSDILNINIYVAYKESFDILFGGNISFAGMAEILKNWDLADDRKRGCSDKLASLLKVLNNDVKGGVPVKKYRLNNSK